MNHFDKLYILSDGILDVIHPHWHHRVEVEVNGNWHKAVLFNDLNHVWNVYASHDDL